MAGQGIDRRDILRMLAYASAAASFPGFSKWAYARAEQNGNQPAATSIRPAQYSPQFFDTSHYALLARLTDVILPPGNGDQDRQAPGAVAAGVPEFIDFIVSHDSALQYPFRTGLRWIDARSREIHGEQFLELPEDQQIQLLHPLAYRSEFQAGMEDGRGFFRLLRKYTVIGFYTSRTGMEQLGAPGLKLYSESPGCPHDDDPEHKNLASSMS